MNALKRCDLGHAILKIKPNSEITQRGDKWTDIEFHDGNPSNITEEQALAKQKELIAEYESNQYQRDRQPEYPELPEQLDMLFHAIDAGALDKTSAFYTTLKAVKDKYPKA